MKKKLHLSFISYYFTNKSKFSKKLALIFFPVLLLILFTGKNLQAQLVSNAYGFEDITAAASTGWVGNGATESFSNSTTVVRTGVYSKKFTTTSTSGNRYSYNNRPYVDVTSATGNVHYIYWAKTEDPTSTQVDASMRYSSSPPSGAGSTVNSSAPVTISTSVWTRVVYTNTNTSTRSYFPSPRRVTGIATSYYMDDEVIYTSTSSTPDLTKPNTPGVPTGSVSGTTVNLSWTSATDAATGVQATLILRTTNTAAAAPVLNDQALYSTAGGASGPNSPDGVWTIISTTTGATATTYSDITPGGTFKYAIVLRDLAYNYSVAAISTPISTCTPFSVTAPVHISKPLTPGASSIFSVTTPATSPAFTWQYSANGTSAWATVSSGTPANITYGTSTSGSTTSSLTVTHTPSAASGNYYYRCIVDASPSCPTASDTASLTLVPPAPTITSLVASSATVGDPTPYTLTVNGTNFTASAVVNWNGSPLVTTYVSATQVTAQVPAGSFSAPAVVPVSVTTSAGTTGTLNFTISALVTGRICAAVGGTFTIDNTGANTGTNFTSFTAAINDLNGCSPLTKNIVFNVVSGQTFTETTPSITVTTGSYTVTFQKSSTAHALILAGTAASGSADAIVTIKSSNITFDGIDVQENPLNTTAGTKMEIGYALIPGSTASNNTIKNSNISGMSASVSAAYGIYAILQNGLTITHNTISNIVESGAGNSSIGISLATITGNASVSSNNISNINNTNTTSTSGLSYGLYMVPSASSVISVYNNFVSNIFNAGASSANVNAGGIYLNASTNTLTANIYYNSIYLTGTYKATSAAFYTAGANLKLNLKNNIFKYNGSQTSRKAYCVYFTDGTAIVNSPGSSDYNVYDMRSPLGASYFTGYDGSDRSVFSSWQVATSQDINSKQFSVQFQSSSDLHLAVLPDASYDALALGAPFDYDIDDQVRGTGAPASSTAPVVGADEVPRTIPAVVITQVHPGDQNIARSTTDLIIGTFKIRANNVAADFNSIKIKFGGAYTTGTTDFTNFRIYYNTTNTFAGSTLLQNIPGGAPASGSTYTASSFSTIPNIDPSGDPEIYVFVVCDVQSATPDGTQIRVEDGVATDFGFVGTVTKFGGDLAAGGWQTVCSFYYNSATQANGGVGGFLQTTDISRLEGWRVGTDGAGGPPSSFSLNNSVFNIIYNGATFVLNNSLAIDGNLSVLQVGTTAAAVVTLTIPTGKTLAGVIDVKQNDQLIFQNAIAAADTAALKLRSLDYTSLVNYSGNTGYDQIVVPANYGNLTLSGTGNKILGTDSTIAVANVFSPTSTGTNTVAGSTVAFNGAVVAQTVPAFTFGTLVIKNSTATQTSMSGDVTVTNGLLVQKNFIIGSAPRRKLTIAVGTTNVTATSPAICTVNGDMVNLAIGQIFTTSTVSLLFNSGSIYNLASAATAKADTADIPLATWNIGSTMLISGIVGPSGGADYVGLNGNYQPFGKVVIDCANLRAKLLLTNATYGGFSADKLIVSNTGSAPSTKSGLMQISRQSVQRSVYVNEYYQSSGIVVVAENVSSETLYRSLNVKGNFTVKDSLPGSGAGQYSSVFRIANSNKANDADPDGDVTYPGYLRVGGDFYMAPTSKLEKLTDKSNGNAYATVLSTSNIVFNGSTGNQTAIFPSAANIVGVHHIEVNKTTPTGQPANTKDSVLLQTDLSITTVRLTKGKLAITSGNTLTVNGSTMYGYYPTNADINLMYNYSNYNTTGNTGTGTISGTDNSSLIINSATAGSFRFTTNRGNIGAAHILGNLTLNNGATATLSALQADGTQNSLLIANTLTVGTSAAATLTTNDRLILKSDATKTARIATLPSPTTAISGKVCVERFVPQARKWRLLSGQQFNDASLTINRAWQDSVYNTAIAPWPAVNNVKRSGYATHITRGNAIGAGGYDYTVWQPSLRAFGGVDWGTLTNGNVFATDNSNVEGYLNYRQGYLLFIRGDRNVYLPAATGAPTLVTTLRPVGTLRTGDVVVNTSGVYTVIGNPYASAVNYNTVTRTYTGLKKDDYIVWYPKKGGGDNVGGWVNMVYAGAGVYTTVPTGLGSDISLTGMIESGQAIMVENTGSVTFKESDKISGSGNGVFRPSGNSQLPEESMRVNMYAVEADGSNSVYDGTLSLFDNSYNNDVDLNEDAGKMNNFSENLAIYKYKTDQYLTLERRKPVVSTDTVFYRIYAMKQRTYLFEFINSQMDHPNLVGILEDSYTKSRTVLNLNGTTTYRFTIDANAASKNSDRFRVVFSTVESGPLPVTFIDTKAWQKNADIAVQWNVVNQLNILSYEIERSADGRSFTKIGAVNAVSDNASTYNWMDINPVQGDNYYRIKSVDKDGKITYTRIVKVNIGTTAKGILVYPNPVKNGNIGLQMTNMPEGDYGVRLTNTLGQVLLTKTINRAGGSSTESIKLNQAIAKGIYNLEIVSPDNSKTILKVINE